MNFGRNELIYVLTHSHRVSLETIVCYFHTFENNLGIKEKFSKYLKGSCCLTAG